MIRRMSDDGNMLKTLAFAIFALSFCTDIYFDLQEGLPLSHIWHEVGLCVMALLMLVWQGVTILKQSRNLQLVSAELLDTKQSYQEWKQKIHHSSQEIGQMIDQQFALWHLSQSEKEVALLLIKGFSMKEIAQLRATQEKTVRQQATTIYRKASLSGRQELAAFFLEDLLSLPQQNLVASPVQKSAQMV